MLYAVIDADGVAWEIKPGVVFASTQLKVAEDEAEHYEVQPGTIIAHPLIHAENALECWGPQDFERYQVHQVAEPATPKGRELLSYKLTWADGQLTAEAVTAAPTVPEEVERAKFLLELLGRPSKRADKSLLDDVEDAIAVADGAGKRAMQIYWSGMAVFHRDSPTLDEILQLAKFSGELVDDLFISAAKQI